MKREVKAENLKSGRNSENKDHDVLLRPLNIWCKTEQKWLMYFDFCHSGYKLVVIVGSHVEEIMFSGL